MQELTDLGVASIQLDVYGLRLEVTGTGPR
jgi:hypothetical protein